MNEIHCLCGEGLMDAPPSWGACQVREIGGRRRASGKGIVKRCRSQRCKRWVDITFEKMQAAA